MAGSPRDLFDFADVSESNLIREEVLFVTLPFLIGTYSDLSIVHL